MTKRRMVVVSNNNKTKTKKPPSSRWGPPHPKKRNVKTKGQGAAAAATKKKKTGNEALIEKKKRLQEEEEENSSSLEESSSSSSDSDSNDDASSSTNSSSVAEEKKEVSKQRRKEESSSSSDSGSDSSDSEDCSTSSEEDKQTKKKSDSSASSSNGSDSDDDDEEKGGAFFTDENAAWLKPKKKSNDLLSSSDSDNDDDEEDLLEVERQSKLVDLEMEQEQTEARLELERTIARETQIYHLPTKQELADDQENRVVPPSELRTRIENILEVLADFPKRREPQKSRSDYVDRFTADLAELHGYLPELMEHIVEMLGPTEAYEFVVASDATRPLVVRTNTIKTRRKDLAAALMKRGVMLDPLANWSKVGLLISSSNIPIGATPEYLSGHYMLQSAASMCPVLALEPKPKERILDMSAAPGGKTSYIAQLMQNTGSILANDLKASRQKATVANLHRLGVRNVITACHDGRKLGKLFENRFDRVLLDAPCSGLGVISRDFSVKVQRTLLDIKRTAHLQKELLLSAIDALSCKGAGIMVYSTCSVSVLENEEVVNYALTKRDVKIVDTGLEFGKPGFTRFQNKRFHPSVALTRRFYPHVHNMDGFFVAKIQKLSNRRPEDTLDEEDVQEEEEPEEEEEVANDQKKEKGLKQNNKRGKKRRQADEDPQEQAKKKRETLSVPPKNTKKKRKPNAKTLKPRRQKANIGM